MSGLAAEEGARPDTASLQEVEVAIDTSHADRIGPFWAAVLGGTLAGNAVSEQDR